MSRMLDWSLVGALIGGGTGAVIAVAGDNEDEIFIAIDQPSLPIRSGKSCSPRDG